MESLAENGADTYKKTTDGSTSSRTVDVETKTLVLPANVLVRVKGSPLQSVEISMLVHPGDDAKQEKLMRLGVQHFLGSSKRVEFLL